MKKYIFVLPILLLLIGCSKTTNDNNIETKEEQIKEDVKEDVNQKEEQTNIETTPEEEVALNENNENNVSNSDGNNQEIIENNNQQNELVDTTNINSEEDVINYFEKLRDKIKEKLNSDTWENVKESIMEALNTAYGFCFKGEEIGGYTLRELSDSTKEKILNIVFDIDTFIESKSPGYKDQFKESYDTLIESTKESFGIIKDKIIDFFSKEEKN